MSHKRTFSSSVPLLQTEWSASSLDEFMFCPRRYFYTRILGYNSRKESIHLTFGRMYHEALEVYDRTLIGTGNWKEARSDAFDKILEISYGWESEDKLKNRYSLIRAVVWYMEHWRNDSIQTYILSDGSPAVELSFALEMDLNTPDGDSFLLIGRLDSLALLGDDIVVMDRKTTKKTLNQSYFESFSPNTQVSLYTLACKSVLKVPVSRVIIDAVQIAVNFSNFSRGFSDRSPAQLEEFLLGLRFWFQSIQSYAEMATHHQYDTKIEYQKFWPMNTKNCWNCPFSRVCDKEPNHRAIFLKEDFVSNEEV